MSEEIKLIEWELDDVMGELKRISLVSEPAIEEDFLLFNSQSLKFKTIDDEKRVLTGPAMRPDINIPRKDEMGNLYYGYFSKDTVRKCAEIFFKKGSNANNTNLEHEFEIDGVFVFESWIVEDPEMDKAKALGFKNIKAGDWFVSMKIDNDTVWNNYLKTGLIRGFSVEVKASEIEIMEKLKSIMSEDITDDDKWELLMDMFADTYNDYPKAAVENAKAALRWAEKNGWGSCGTPVGKIRANQLAKGENISKETIARMAGFERHRQNSDKELGDGCGRLMWLSWGGDEGIEWASRKLDALNRK
jgi:hypothetical protein